MLVRIALLFLGTLVFSVSAKEPIILGYSEFIQSNVLAEKRRISVYLPRSYQTAKSKTFDVLYLLDGSANLMHTAGSQYFLAGYRQMPELIIVAVHNTNRNRDFTPSKMETVQNSGGADQFRKFIQTELIPHIGENYRVSERKYLSGHSYGGLFALDTLVKSPEMFDAYFTFSPSLRWDNDRVLNALIKTVQEKQLTSYLYLNIGDEGYRLKRPMLKLHEVLKALEPSKFRWHVDWLDEENHSTTPVIGQFLAFRNYFSQ